MTAITLDGRTTTSGEAASFSSLFRRETYNDSSGPIGFISRVSADRLKGFVGAQRLPEKAITPIRSKQQLRMLVEVVKFGISELDRTGTTRLSIRSLVRDDLLLELAAALSNHEAKLEAAIPLKNGMGGMQLVYLGYNKPLRRDLPGAPQRNEKVRFKAEKSTVLRMDLLKDPKINMEIINNGMPSGGKITEASPLVEMLMGGFGYSKTTALAVLSDERNIVALVRKDNVIAGMNITEIRRIPIADGSSLQIAEITDCYIRPEHRGKGYHSLLLQTLMDAHLRKMDLVFTESNAENQAMVNSILRRGHRIAGDGKTIPGVLEAHAEIEGMIKSLFVTYLP